MSCVEIAAVAAEVLPDYEDRVTFVDVLTNDPEAASVLARYPGQYIPTSVFIGTDGEVFNTVIGPLSDAEMREHLDALSDAAG